VLLICIISRFCNNFILKLGKKATALGSVLRIVWTVGPDGLFIMPTHGYSKWTRKTNKT